MLFLIVNADYLRIWAWCGQRAPPCGMPGTPGRWGHPPVSRELPVSLMPVLLRWPPVCWASVSCPLGSSVLSTWPAPSFNANLFPHFSLGDLSCSQVILGEAGPRVQLLGDTALPHSRYLYEWLPMYVSIHLLMFLNWSFVGEPMSHSFSVPPAPGSHWNPLQSLGYSAPHLTQPTGSALVMSLFGPGPLAQ